MQEFSEPRWLRLLTNMTGIRSMNQLHRPLVMSWTEREGPPVSAPKRRGFGTIVMEAMAERSVDGAVDLD
jgi:two-component sensor histidine kinase